MDFKNLLSNVGKAIKSNAPEILTALGVSGVITTSYLAAKAGKEHQSRMSEEAPDTPLKEEAKAVWKFYIPVGISGVVTIGCIIGASRAGGHRTAAAVTAYSLTEKAFSEYKEKVIEQVGKGKEQKIRDAIAQDAVTSNPPSKEVVIVAGGHVLCCELYTHRYFRCEMETLKKYQNEINHLICQQMYVTLNDFYDMIELPYTDISDSIGWDSNKLMELMFTTVLSENGEPCLAFTYNYVKLIHE